MCTGKHSEHNFKIKISNNLHEHLKSRWPPIETVIDTIIYSSGLLKKQKKMKMIEMMKKQTIQYSSSII